VTTTEAGPTAATIVKAYKLIEAGHVRIQAPERVVAHVRSLKSGETYQVVRTAAGRWSCGCDASRWNVGPCSHIEAVRLVT
jgi:hypothetical protein